MTTNRHFLKMWESCFIIYPELKSLVDDGTIDKESIERIERKFRTDREPYYNLLDIGLGCILARIRDGEEWRDLDSWIDDAIKQECSKPWDVNFDSIIGIDGHKIFCDID